MVTRAVVLAHRMVLEGGHELSAAAVGHLRRTLSSLARIGVTEACVVDGDHAAELQGALVGPELGGMRVEVLANCSWRRASGSALLLARDFLARSPEPCLVVRGERPLDPESLAELAAIELAELGRTRAVITVAEPPDWDLASEVKVRLADGDRSGTIAVAALGLDLDRHDAVYTGHAVVSADIVGELERWSNPSLEDALAVWVAAGRVRARPGRVAWPWSVARRAEMDDKVAAILETKAHPAYTLFNPGPVNTTAGVKSALVHQDVCHRDAAFSELMVSLTGKLRRIFRGSPDHTVCMVTGSGTAAMECAISSTVPKDGKILVIDNGAFGERLYEIARLHEMDIVHLRYAWGDPVVVADVERMFEQHPDIAVVAMVHHETSVGLLGPVREVGAICRRPGHDALLLVDAVSSLGAEELDVVRDQIDVCWSSANKCLHAISGVGFLCVSPRVWGKIESIKPRSYYLDLKRYRKYVEELAQTPFTPAVSSYFALDQACSEFLADGHARRFAMYRQRNARLRAGLAALGMAPLTRTGCESHSVITCCVPAGVRFQDFYHRLKRRGFILYACKDVLADRFMQVANMGDLPADAIDALLAAMAEVIAELRDEARALDPADLATSAAEPLRATAAKRSSRL
jgi:2-aminoethylphosphonate-pyruvate transaminase